MHGESKAVDKPINQDQAKNLEKHSEAVISLLLSAWQDYWFLKGLHQGANKHHNALEQYAEALSAVWRSVFLNLIALIGAIVDKTPNTNSLPSLLKMVKRYFGKKSENTRLANRVLKKLEDENSAILKLLVWRHKVVAHNSREFESVFIELEMHMSEIESILDALTAAIGDVVLIGSGISYIDIKKTSFSYIAHGEKMLEKLSA